MGNGALCATVSDICRTTAEYLAGLLRDHRAAIVTVRGRRALGCFRQAVHKTCCPLLVSSAIIDCEAATSSRERWQPAETRVAEPV